MKKLTLFVMLATLLCSLCACGAKADNAEKKSDTGNFSSEMLIEGDSDVTIVEMP